MIIKTDNGMQYDSNDILTVKDALDPKTQEIIGKKAFVGDSIGALNNAIKANTPQFIADVTRYVFAQYPFLIVDDACFALCLPADKVSRTAGNNKEPWKQAPTAPTEEQAPLEEEQKHE